MRIDPLKTQYSTVLDISVIAAIIVVMAVMHLITIRTFPDTEKSKSVVIELAPSDAKSARHAPPPRRPAVPIASDQEVMLGDETIDDTDIDLEEVPPPPPPPFKKEQRGSDDIFTTYDTRPLLKGGEDFLKRNLRYPDAARQAGIEGLAMVKAVIDDKGNVVRADIVREDGNVGFGQAAIDFVTRCKFEPATFKGKPVKVAVTLPISFKKSLLQ